jgi:hypothetical protein
MTTSCRCALILVIVGLLATSLRAQFSPPIPVDPPDIYFLGDLKYFDVNADSYQDLVVSTTTYDHRVIWYPNDGAGHYLPAIRIATVAEVPIDVEFGDIDGDGHSDIVYALPNAGVIGWCRNNGQAQFTIQAHLFLALEDLRDISLIDADGDLDSDLVAVIGSTNETIYSTNTASSFSPPIVMATDMDSGLHACGDLNGDGVPDLVIMRWCCPQVTVQWFAGDGNGGWGPPTTIPADVNGVYVLSLKDVDTDGDADVLLGLNQNFYCLFNDGNGGFSQATLLMDVAPQYFSQQRMGDFDGDGDYDIACKLGTVFGWFPNLGNFTWGPLQDLSLQINGGYAKYNVADADNDGDDELTVSLLLTPVLCQLGTNGDLTVEVDTVSRPARTYTQQLIAAEINGDGLIDLLETSLRGEVVWYPGIDGSTWGQAIPLFKYEDYAYGIQAVDIDGDSDNDVITTGQGSNWYQLMVHENDGTGGFAIAQSLGQGAYSSARILSADIDSDGDMDIVSDGNGPCLNLNTNGILGPCTTVGIGSIGNTLDILLEDLDQDGNEDFICTLSHGWKYRLGDGNGGFGPILTGGSWPGDDFASIEATDMDGDGDLDIITWAVQIQSAILGWYENLGLNQWSPIHMIDSLSGGGAMYRLAISDIDKDGDIDVMANHASASYGIGYYLNDGTGEFSPSLTFTQVGFIGTLADINGDGFEDALVGATDHRRVHENLFDNPYRMEGAVFYDVNNNGLHDPVENGLPYRPLLTTPYGEQVFTNAAGAYSALATAGPNTVSTLILDPFWNLSTDSTTYHHILTPNSSVSIGNDFGYAPTNSTWAHLSVTISNPRCDFTSVSWINVLNIGSTITSGVLTVEWDSLVAFVSSTPPPDSISGQLCYWQIDSLTYGELKTINAIVLMPNAGQVGSLIDASASFLTISPEEGLSFNAFFSDALQCSFDPNDKQVTPPGTGVQGLIPINTEWLDYTIRFQNTGTAPAATVIVKDLISLNLDRHSLQLLGTSHELTGMSIRPDGVAEFTFEGIELPDSASNEPGSHGFVRYRIRPNVTASHGSIINNTASIYFDSNEPVITNTVINTLVDCDLWGPSITAIEAGLLEATGGEAYQWYFNGVAIKGAENNMFEPLATGSYTVEVTSEYGCVATSEPYWFIITSTTTINPQPISIHPNPMDGVAIVKFGSLHGIDRLELFDITGRTVRSIALTNADNISLDRGDLPAGQYFVKAIERNGREHVLRVIMR